MVGILQVLPMVLLMGHDGLDIEHLLLKVHAGDKPVLVAADVKDERSGSGGEIGGRERLLDFRKMLPSSGPYHVQEAEQRLARWGVPFCELFRRRFAGNRHVQMFP